MAVLNAENIEKYFGGITALCGVNLKCEKGRISGLVGPNGSGKSTFCKIISGVLQRDGGTINYNNKQCQYKNPKQTLEDGIAMVYQNLSLAPNLSVWENISLGDEKTGGFMNLFKKNKEAKERARKWIDKLSPEIDINAEVIDLNPGDRQVVEIAKAMSKDSNLIIFDEPTSRLKHTQIQNLFTVMRELAEQGTSMIFISHRLPEVMEICDDIVVFRDGENVGQIDVNETEEKEVYRRLLYLMTEEENFQEREERSYSVLEEDKEAILKVDNFSGAESRAVNLKDISFELKKGEILGIGGLAGQGQDELMMALAGGLSSSGLIEIDGERIDLKIPRDAIRKGMVLVPGDKKTHGLFMRHTVLQNIVNTRYAYKDQPIINPQDEYEEESKEVIEMYSIDTPGPYAKINNLSGGNQQKVVFGKWFARDPKILLLADPTKGVDVKARKKIYDIMQKMVDKRDLSILLFASDNDELIDNCDRLKIMYEGTIVDELAGEKITEDNILASSLRISDEEGEEIENG